MELLTQLFSFEFLQAVLNFLLGFLGLGTVA